MSEIANGTWGHLWLDGDEESDLVSFQLKEEYQKEEYRKCRSMITYNRVTGYALKGSIKVNKTGKNNKKIADKIMSDVRKGITPKFTLIGGLDDEGAEVNERYQVTGVVFDDLTLFDFEVGKNITVEMPFTAEDCKPL